MDIKLFNLPKDEWRPIISQLTTGTKSKNRIDLQSSAGGPGSRNLIAFDWRHEDLYKFSHSPCPYRSIFVLKKHLVRWILGKNTRDRSTWGLAPVTVLVMESFGSWFLKDEEFQFTKIDNWVGIDITENPNGDVLFPLYTCLKNHLTAYHV